MKFLAPIAVAVILYLLLYWMRSGKGGEIGRRVRLSDWHAWNDAVREKEQELSELKKLEPKR